MADAYASASNDGAYPVLSQQVFYAARPGILEKLGRDELTPKERGRFCYQLLPQFIQENLELTAGWRVIYKARGELVEPHTGRRVGLGTVEVAAYHRRSRHRRAGLGGASPSQRFGGVLVVMKGGIADLLRELEIDLKHDLAIVGNEG
jgi:hypothetical protein